MVTGLVGLLLLIGLTSSPGLATDISSPPKNTPSFSQTSSSTNEDSSYLEYTEPRAYPAPSLFYSSLRSVFSLLAVVGLIYFFFYILRRSGNHQRRIFSDNRQVLGIIGRLHLSPRKIIYLVRIGEKVFAVGVDDRIHLLATLDDETAAKLGESLTSQPLEVPKFSDYLKKFFPSRSKESAHFFFPQTKRLKDNE